MSTSTSAKEPQVVRYENETDVHVYRNFWAGRSYEELSERTLLGKLYRSGGKSKGWLIDIGGSYGRLLDVYAKTFSSVAILDYSTNEIIEAKKVAVKIGLDIHLIAANAYHLPFADDSQKEMICIRVTHHLEDVKKFLDESYRVMAPGSRFVLEAANKNHYKRWLICLFRANFSSWRSDWTDIGASGVQSDGNFALIRNYSPKYLEQTIYGAGFLVMSKHSISYLRSTPLKKLPGAALVAVESLVQLLFGRLMIGPSNWYVLTKPGVAQSGGGTDFETTLVDPKTKAVLTSKDIKAQTDLIKGVAVIDLRYPKPKSK